LKQREIPRLEILYIFTRKKKNDPDTIYCPEIQRKEVNFASADAMKENSR